MDEKGVSCVQELLSCEEHFRNQCAQSIDGEHDDNKTIHKPAFDKVQKLGRAEVQASITGTEKNRSLNVTFTVLSYKAPRL